MVGHQAPGEHIPGTESFLCAHLFPCLGTRPRSEVNSALYRWQLPKPSPFPPVTLWSKGLRESTTEYSTFLLSQNFWGLGALAGGWSLIGSCLCLTELLCIPLFPASANICNVVLMRYGELEEGIDVLDADGNLVGSSKIAARHVGFPGAKPCQEWMGVLIHNRRIP